MTSQGPSASLNLFSNMGPVSSRDPGASQGQSTRADSLGTFATMSPTKLRHAAYEHATTYRTLLYNVNSDTTKITPTWGKVSETPWFGEARRLRGFGRPVVSATTSKDAPLFMSHRSSNYTEKRIEPRVPPGKESQYVLPGGPNEETKARADSGRARILKLNWRNQVVFEPIESARPTPTEVNNQSTSRKNNIASSSTNGNGDSLIFSGRGNSDIPNTTNSNRRSGRSPEGRLGSSRDHPQSSSRPSTNTSRAHGGVVAKQRRY